MYCKVFDHLSVSIVAQNAALSSNFIRFSPLPNPRTLLWYDLETFGRHPACNAIAQFAACRTDTALHVLDEGQCVYCHPPEDMLPDPEAVLVHGITPQQAAQRGLTEYCFAAKLAEQVQRSEQCICGYNNLRFDDQFLRHLFFRNFHDPYAHEYQHGNSRWDLIDLLRLTALLCPHYFYWPLRPDGAVSFRLEALAKANGIAHRSHDASGDITATIALARRLRAQNAKLFDYFFAQMRDQVNLRRLLQRARAPVLHLSGHIHGKYAHATLVQPLMPDNQYRKKWYLLDLRNDPRPWLACSVENLRDCAFSSQDTLSKQGLSRLPVKGIYLNRCPLLCADNLTEKTLARTPRAQQRMRLDYHQAKQHWLHDDERAVLIKKLCQALKRDFPPKADVEMCLYDHFIPDTDRTLMAQLRAAPPAEIMRWTFSDPRLEILKWRYKARNHAQTLTASERNQWREHCQKRFFMTTNGEANLPERIATTTARLRIADGEEKVRLTALLDFFQSMMVRYGDGEEERLV